MDRVYSLTLGVAIALAAGSLAALLASALTARKPGFAAVARRVSGLAARASLALALASAGVHLAAGHRPGSPEALGPLDFVREHPALLAVMLLAAIAWWGARRAGGRRAGAG